MLPVAVYRSHTGNAAGSETGLPAHIGAPDGSRTHTLTLEGCHAAINITDALNFREDS